MKTLEKKTNYVTQTFFRLFKKRKTKLKNTHTNIISQKASHKKRI